MTSRTLRLASLAFTLSVTVAACTRGGGDVPDVGPVPDTGLRDAPFLYPDSSLGRDGGGWDGGPSSGLQCESCTTDDDCASGSYCVPFGDGSRLCLESCNRDLPDCPPRFDCIDSLSTDLPEPVCTPVGERCCVDADGDDRGVGVGCRGPDCNESDPAAYFGAPERCNLQDDNCDGTSDEGNPEGGLVCSTGLSGTCAAGATACVDGAVTCEANAASVPEVCNGVDDDCDANVDEDDAGRALTRPCYSGPAGTDGMGGCSAGVQTCAGGEYRTCVGEVLPSIEDCDGVDDDCDGTIDDGNPGAGFECANAAPGVCARGITQCRGGTVGCYGMVTPGSMPEICDDVDNDCDGMLNEGFPGLGEACTAGLGACRRGGVTVCNPADRSAVPICDGVPGTPSPVETCDYTDDNCNGTTDEGFRNASGIYDTVTNCRACGNDCTLGWPGGAAASHVVPNCTVSGGTASCGFTCVAGWIDADRVRENGCELFPETGTIYVSTPEAGGANGSTCGTWDAPCATIAFGIGRALGTSRTRVRVASGLFVENVALQNGISVLGGHSSLNWVRNPALFATVVRGSDAAALGGGPNDRIVVSAVGITTSTELSGFSIDRIGARAGGNSIGIYVRDSTNALLIQDNSVSAGAGGNGATGVAGAAGATGAVGGTGRAPERRACGSGTTAGGTGGYNACGATNVSGGTGGNGTSTVTSSGAPTRSGPGSMGQTGLGGGGGAGGFHMEGTSTGPGRSCVVYSNPIEGADGTAGRAGTDGAGGGGAASGTGTIAANQWRGVAGVTGSTAAPGGGGGGGGASGGVDADGSAYCLYGATGGGGGSAGCQGSPGNGGEAGGASFAIFVLHTSTPTLGAMPRILNNELRRSNGGRGGDGGTGGGGGEGGDGGAGGPATSTDPYGYCLVAGGRGGPGGRGGHGGGGGGGAGGASYEIWVSRPGTAMPDYSGNTFGLAAGATTGGGGGGGGNSSNTTIGVGGAGVAGAFGNVRIGT